MKRLLAYKQFADALLTRNGNWVDFTPPNTFYDEWTATNSGADPAPQVTSVFNPISGTFDSTARFQGSATTFSQILQSGLSIDAGDVVQITYRIGKHTNPPPNSITIVLAGNIQLNCPNAIGVHTINMVASNNNGSLIFRYNAGGAINDLFLDWIEVRKLEQFELDLFDNEEINLTYEIDDIRNIDSKNSGYSKSFSIPASKTNSKFFKHAYSLSDSGEWNPYEKAGAILVAEGIEVFHGFMKLDDIVKRDNHSFFNITLFEEIADLKTELGSKTLANLGWSQLSHDYTKTNIVDSWTGNLELHDGTTTDAIKYPFCNWIGNFDDDNGNLHMLNFQDAFRPWVNAKYIWDRIFDQSSFQYTSDFIDSNDFSKLYVDWNFGESFSQFGGGYSDFADFRIDTEYFTGPADGPLLSQNAYTNPDYVAVTQVGAAQVGGVNNGFFNLATDTFTATEDNQSVYVFVNALMKGAGSGDLLCEVSHNSTVPGCLPNQYLTSGPNLAGTTVIDQDGTSHTWDNTFQVLKSIYTGVGTFVLNQGETLKIKYAKTSVNQLRLAYSNVIFHVQAGVELDPTTVGNRTKIKQFDFIKAITQMFNLVMVPHDSNPKYLKIEPAKDYYESGETLDWTKKIDVSEIQIVPHDISREYRFRMKNDQEDYHLQKYFETNDGKVFGEHIKRHPFEVVSNDIQEHENALFSPTYMKKYPGFAFIPYIFGKEDSEFSEIKNNIRILYDTGVHNCNSFSSETQNGAQFSNQTTCLFFSPIQNLTPTIDDLQVDYGQSISFTPGGIVPYRTLFFEYYQDIIKQLTERESRIVKVKAELNASDVVNFEFKDTIFFQNQLYRVNRLEYNTTPGELSTIELIRLSSETNFVNQETHGKKECKSIVFAISINGDVLFANPNTGLPVPATEDCCKQYGYNWFGSPINKCNFKEDAYGHGHGHGTGIEHHDNSWSGGHSLVLGNKNSNGFGLHTNNIFIAGNKNSAQSHVKNLMIIGTKNQLGRDIKNTMIVGTKHKVDEPVDDVTSGVGIDDSIVSGKGAFVKASNVKTFASNDSDVYILQKTECIYKGRVTTNAQTEIFLNGVTNSRYKLPDVNAFVTIQVDIYGIISDSASRDFGHYTRKRYIVTGAGVGASKTRIDDVDEVSHHTNHGSSWAIDIDETSQNLRIRVTGSRDATEWVAHCTIMEQDFTT